MKIAMYAAVVMFVTGVPAHAVLLNAAYTGAVTSQSNTSFAVGSGVVAGIGVVAPEPWPG